jgi:glycosyltransferase involved in cell wall biosynthesis
VRIAFLHHVPTLFGASRSLLDLLRHLRGFGVTPHVICAGEGPLVASLREMEVPVRVLPLQRWMARRPTALWPAQAAGRLAANVALFPRVLQQLRAWRIDLVYSNSSYLPVGPWAAHVSRRPHVWHIREFGALDYGHLHDWGTGSFDFWLRRANAVIAVSKAVRDTVLAGVPAERVRIVYNGVSPARDVDRRRRLAGADRPRDAGFRFTLVGWMRPTKGQHVAIRAFASLAERFPRAQLEIVGTGEPDYVRSCLDLAQSLGLAQRVSFTGFLPDPWPAYERADAVLMCSSHEAMGRVTAEAMATGRAVIGFDRGGTPELIAHETTGLLYRGDADALAAAMIRCLERPEWVCQLGRNGWAMARERFTTERYAQEVYQVIEAVMAGRALQ